MEVPYVDRIKAQPTAGCVARPRPKRGGNEHKQHPHTASAQKKHAEGGMKTAYEKSQDGGGADIHGTSIRRPSAGDYPRGQ